MIKSMTGFSAITREDEWATMTVTIRALNHRYLDLQLRIPQALAAIEPAVRTLVGRSVSRGRIELSLSLQLRQTPAVEVEFNEIVRQRAFRGHRPGASSGDSSMGH